MRLYKGRYGDRRRMSFRLKKTNQLLLVPLLAEDLVSQEKLQIEIYANEFLDWPRSVTSSRLICQILMNAPDVSPAVKEWAKIASKKDAPETLSEVRKFWAKNQALFAAKTYSALSVPD